MLVSDFWCVDDGWVKRASRASRPERVTPNRRPNKPVIMTRVSENTTFYSLMRIIDYSNKTVQPKKMFH